MHQLTVRGFDPELERRLRLLAQRDGVSLTRAAVALMRRGAGLEEPARRQDRVGTSLDHLIGTWSAEEEEELRRAVEILDEVDPALWT